ncbi:MAG: hypothetical protein K6B70_00690 [Clostridia bacterium]|nr:hypothetical protein [Clostridia bacterium]
MKKVLKIAGIALLIIVCVAILIVFGYYFLVGALKVLFGLSIFCVFILNGKKR